MPILVICSGCGAKFNVAEKFAGKQGPCPKCKAVIRVPSPDDVKIAEPEAFGGGKDTKGRPVLKPLERAETKLSHGAIAAMVGGLLGTVLVAWLAGPVIREQWWLRALGLVAVAFPLSVGAYSILRDSELEPYRGSALYLRAGACALAYAALWGVFGLLPDDWTTGESWVWFLLAPPFVLVGAGVAFACFDLDFGTAALHYSGFVLASLVLRWLAGMPMLWQTTELVWL